MEGICYSFTLLISDMVFNPFKMAVQFLHPNFDGSNDVFRNSTGPWPQIQKGGKILGNNYGHIDALQYKRKC